MDETISIKSQSLFYWITYSYGMNMLGTIKVKNMSQSLFYWITYSYKLVKRHKEKKIAGLNPYFIGLPILISLGYSSRRRGKIVSILILLDYLFLLKVERKINTKGA